MAEGRRCQYVHNLAKKAIMNSVFVRTKELCLGALKADPFDLFYA
eukprot:CAMPEP_0119318910 /NCGR_PEP_ID=MMETSP1333-20130426/47987_1 /TAXON_ID=418940 /ORGANISM="Scyphosphaera apsteinii, Strain RCC1455" /LENGTH=44 /DNA_ID= /DNA_START= /DNA_END= /DNA_ORIENTATION=